MPWIKLFVFGRSRTMQLSIAGVAISEAYAHLFFYSLFFEVGEELAELNDEFELYVEVLFDMGWHLKHL